MTKPPTLDTAPDDLAHAPEVPHHRFSAFYECGDYAYARGLEVNPTHLPIALDAMRKSGWHLVSLFGNTDSKHVGFIFRRQQDVNIFAHEFSLNKSAHIDLCNRVDNLVRVNNDLVDKNRGFKMHLRRMQNMMQQYVAPGYEPYVAENGQAYIDADAGFIHDMIYMLDGPEQREILPNDT